MINMRVHSCIQNGISFIFNYEYQVFCDRCQVVVVDWTRSQPLSFPVLPIPEFDYETGSINIDHQECLCPHCFVDRTEELENKGVRFQYIEGGYSVEMPIPEDYIPSKPSWWKRLKSWLYGRQ